jgi:hypothetical protein
VRSACASTPRLASAGVKAAVERAGEFLGVDRPAFRLRRVADRDPRAGPRFADGRFRFGEVKVEVGRLQVPLAGGSLGVAGRLAAKDDFAGHAGPRCEQAERFQDRSQRGEVGLHVPLAVHPETPRFVLAGERCRAVRAGPQAGRFDAKTVDRHQPLLGRVVRDLGRKRGVLERQRLGCLTVGRCRIACLDGHGKAGRAPRQRQIAGLAGRRLALGFESPLSRDGGGRAAQVGRDLARQDSDVARAFRVARHGPRLVLACGRSVCFDGSGGGGKRERFDREGGKPPLGVEVNVRRRDERNPRLAPPSLFAQRDIQVLRLGRGREVHACGIRALGFGRVGPCRFDEGLGSAHGGSLVGEIKVKVCRGEVRLPGGAFSVARRAAMDSNLAGHAGPRCEQAERFQDRSQRGEVGLHVPLAVHPETPRFVLAGERCRTVRAGPQAGRFDAKTVDRHQPLLGRVIRDLGRKRGILERQRLGCLTVGRCRIACLDGYGKAGRAAGESNGKRFGRRGPAVGLQVPASLDGGGRSAQIGRDLARQDSDVARAFRVARHGPRLVVACGGSVCFDRSGGGGKRECLDGEGGKPPLGVEVRVGRCRKGDARLGPLPAVTEGDAQVGRVG